ncbi:translation initiation factor eIF3 subunit [Trichodelitschia bisporula]|uniref:Eukaryotic translation initiation factor 3 subunit J n=1 Tax=Trichodelitschia bisporula TaxID=703511 RepID=A0A6G1IBQ8_9PEZI|nr:translation initiation factor eIF3 subunit [Trichodelitschia bisporula]
MPPPKKWEDEESSDETSSDESAPGPVVAARKKFDDEEDEDVLESWDAAEDSEVEREKAKKAEEAKAKAEAAAKAAHKTKSQRIEELRQAKLRKRQEEEEEESSDEEEDEAEKRARLRAVEKETDLKHAEDLFGGLAVSKARATGKHVTVADPSDPSQHIDLSALSVFNPKGKEGLAKLRETLVPLIGANYSHPHYVIFMQEFTKQICKDLSSQDVKKIASGLTTLSNEKLKEEKTAEKGGKKKAKAKVTLNASRDISYKADTAAYDDGLEEDDFM